MAHVVTKQPGSGNMVCSLEGHRDWNSGVLSCCTDCKTLLCTFCCLPCAICNISSRLGDCALMPWCVPGALIAMRSRLRTLGGIRGSICNDCLVVACCQMCVICQMQRELDDMGL